MPQSTDSNPPPVKKNNGKKEGFGSFTSFNDRTPNDEGICLLEPLRLRPSLSFFYAKAVEKDG